VPAGQRAKYRINAEVICEIAATSSTVTDRCGVIAGLTPEGASAVQIIWGQLSSDVMVAGDIARAQWDVWGDEGDAFTGQDIFVGDAAGAGRIHVSISDYVEEFDV